MFTYGFISSEVFRSILNLNSLLVLVLLFQSRKFFGFPGKMFIFRRCCDAITKTQRLTPNGLRHFFCFEPELNF